MARRTGWSARLDPKRLALSGLRRATARYPALGRALSFYPNLAGLPDRLEAVAARRSHRSALAEPRFRPALDALAPANWDVRRPQSTSRDEFAAELFIGIVRDVAVPGHTLAPFDPATGGQVAFSFAGPTSWNFAHPGLPRLRTRRLPGPALVLPPHRNYWHLLVEHLLPLMEAARLGAWGTEPLTVITRARRPPLVDAVLDGLRARGATIRVETIGPFETLDVDRFLVAANHCFNTERSYALAGTMPDARAVFEAAYRDRPVRPWGQRIYLARGPVRLRRLTNEADVVAGLAARGFEVLQADWDNHPDQVAAFSGAAIVVGVHGAGLTNLAFSRPGTVAVEVFPDDFRKSTTLHICAEGGIEHHAVFGSRSGRDQAFSVDAPALLARVDGILGGCGAAEMPRAGCMDGSGPCIGSVR